MFRFTGPTIDRDGALDSEILIHELTHGLSNRLIGDGAGLNWDPGGGMGEGWSDFYALSLLNNTNADDPNGNYAMGAYATYKAFGFVSFTDNYLYAIRRFPYSTDNSVNPLTWADVDDYTNNLSGGIAPDPLGSNLGGALEVHNAGEVWALTLWEVRSRVIAANAGNVPAGNQIMLQLTTDALKMTPISPSYTDARDALIDADCATNACANEQSIWDGFADRGLGYGSRVSSAYGFAPVATHQGIVESFSTPYLDVQSISVVDNFGNNNGTIDPGETIRIFVTLRNPWRTAAKGVASATATLTSSTPGLVITDGNSAFPAIPAQGSAAGDQFRFNVPQNATCGQQVKFTITSTSTLGVKAVDFAFRVGAPSGTDAPITYTRTPPAPLAIQDNRPRGVIDSQTITDDFEIADLNFRVDSLPHTFPGDLTVGFKAPNGYGVDLISFIGAALGQGDGDNITNMLIDNQAVGDMLLASDADAPYTGSWLPIANSPTWPLVGFGPEDPVGELNKLNGASTQGTWQALVADEAGQDIGTFNSWSLIVTPVHFVCTGPVTAAPATISGRITTPDGNPLAGVTMNLSGDSNRRAITDSNGDYRFREVETSLLYGDTIAHELPLRSGESLILIVGEPDGRSLHGNT
jgi:subtilisin-like proprotein convertase family protein